MLDYPGCSPLPQHTIYCTRPCSTNNGHNDEWQGQNRLYHPTHGSSCALLMHATTAYRTSRAYASCPFSPHKYQCLKYCHMFIQLPGNILFLVQHTSITHFWKNAHITHFTLSSRLLPFSGSFSHSLILMIAYYFLACIIEPNGTIWYHFVFCKIK